MSEVKYYYIKLKDNFFDKEEIKLLESMKDGYLYSNILLKICLKSLKMDGLLMLNEYIPYDANMLSAVVNHPVGVVKEALGLFEKLGLITVKDSGQIWINNIQELIGKTTNEAERKAIYRNKIKNNNVIESVSTSKIDIKEKEIGKIENIEKVGKNKTDLIDTIKQLCNDKEIELNENEYIAIEKWIDFRTKTYKTKKTEQAIKIQVNNFIELFKANKDIVSIIDYVIENTTWQNITLKYILNIEK